jgi:hypothetical protein
MVNPFSEIRRASHQALTADGGNVGALRYITRESGASLHKRLLPRPVQMVLAHRPAVFISV